MSKDLRDHAPNRANHFTIAEGKTVKGYMVVNTRTGLTAARPSGRRYWQLTLEEATAEAAKLNRRAQAKKICKGCRHKRFADEIEDGRCEECRKRSG